MTDLSRIPRYQIEEPTFSILPIRTNAHSAKTHPPQDPMGRGLAAKVIQILQYQMKEPTFSILQK
jgi:hypothetical protein